MAQIKGKYKVKNADGSYDQVMLQTTVEQVVGAVRSVDNLSSDGNGNINLSSKYLPLAGNGSVIGSTLAKRAVDNSFLAVFGSTADTNGAYALFCGKDYTSSGAFQLTARNSTAKVDLIGYPNGGLTWGGYHVVRAWNYSNAGNGYIKLSTGLIIQWGKHTANGGSHYVTLPTAFTKTSYSVTANLHRNTDYASASVACYTYNTSTTSCLIFADHYPNGMGNTSNTVEWMAIGY